MVRYYTLMNSKVSIRNEINNQLHTKEISKVFQRLENKNIFSNKLLFELWYFLYTVLHLLLQNFNIYRTEFYAYNFTLFSISAIFLSKRLCYGLWMKFKSKHPADSSKKKNLLIAFYIVLLMNFIYCGIKSPYYYSLGSTFCLFYPYFIIIIG